MKRAFAVFSSLALGTGAYGLAFWAVMVALAMHYLRAPHGTQPRVDDGGRGDASA